MSNAIIIGASVAAATLIGVLAFTWSGLTIDKSGEKPLKTNETSPQKNNATLDTLVQATRSPTYNDQDFASFGAKSNYSQEGGRKRKSKRRKSIKTKTKRR